MARTKEEQELTENLKKDAQKIMNNFNNRTVPIWTTISMYTIKNMGDGQHPGIIDELKAYKKE